MRRDHPIAAEVERAMIGSQVRFVVGTVAVLVIAIITDRHNRQASVVPNDRQPDGTRQSLPSLRYRG